MGYSPKKVGPHSLPLTFCPQLFLPFDLSGQSADDNRHRQHRQKGQGISGDGKVELPVGVGKNIIDADDTEKRGGNPVDKAAGKPGSQRHHKNKDHGYEAAGGVHQHQQPAEEDA